jgi:two-component system sensor histidine kinase VicK
MNCALRSPRCVPRWDSLRVGRWLHARIRRNRCWKWPWATATGWFTWSTTFWISSGSARSDVSASELLRQATDLQDATAERAGLRFRIEADPINLWVDSQRILQTLTKLLGNAIKFSPPNSEICLRAHAISETEALIEVQDQGRGIPTEMLDTIFDRFQQGDASDSRASGGTGLGLALCRSLVGLHGGKIWAESTLGLGSSFFFTVPRTQHRSERPIN